jgi:ribonuclease PH
MRSDGRTPTALRPVSFESHYIKHHKGSVLVSFGQTKVLVTATTEDRVPPYRLSSGGGWLTAEYAMLPGSTQTRKKRDIFKGRPDGRSVEIQRLIGRSLRQIVNIDLIGQRTIHVDCDVIQADGGTRTAAITGGWVAVALCVQDLLARRVKMKAKSFEDIMVDQVAAISLGIKEGVVITDLDYVEDVAVDTDFNLVARADGTIVELQGTAEGHSMRRAEVDQLLDQGLLAIGELCGLQKKAVEEAA